MKIPLPFDRRSEALKIIVALPRIRPAEYGSQGYEIPMTGRRHKKGRVHIIFTSDGVEVHRDLQLPGGVHKVAQRSDSANQIFEELKEKLKDLGMNTPNAKNIEAQ